MAAYVRPWNEFWNATIHSRPVATRAIFIAFSTASAPLFANTLLVATVFPSVRGKMRSSSCARRTYGSYVTACALTCAYFSSCSLTAATMSGCWCPRFSAPMPAMKSR